MTITAIFVADQKTTIPGQPEAQLIMLNKEICVIIDGEKVFNNCDDKSPLELVKSLCPLDDIVKYVILFNFEGGYPVGIYKKDGGIVIDITDSITDISTSIC